MKCGKSLPIASVVAAALVATTSSAAAGGMYLPLRGVRTGGTAGAQAASSNDAASLWLNPAGLAAANPEALFDVTLVSQRTNYARIDSGMNPQPTVDNQAAGLPIPSLAAAVRLRRSVVLAGGVWAPYAALPRFDAKGPQRYAAVDLSRSLIATLGVGVGWQVNRKLRLGAALQNHVVALDAELVLSACPRQLICAPEDPSFDALSQVIQRSYFNPSAALGAQLQVAKAVTIGASLQLPVWVSGSGTIAARIPSSPFFDQAQLKGDQATTTFVLPAALRLGASHHRGRARLDLTATIEFWSQHRAIEIVPQNVSIIGAPAIDDYQLGAITIERRFKNTFALALGGEYALRQAVTVRAGLGFETGAPPDQYLSAMTVDGNKLIASSGLGWQRNSLRFDALLGLVAMQTRNVDPSVGKLPQQNPIRDAQDPPRETYINWGRYQSSWILVGVGMSKKL